MACERIRLPHLVIAALAAVLLVLSVPASGHAAERDRLASAGQLASGAGYGTGGSDAVRTLQRRLRRLGDQPGPIDGLYGPLTKGAVIRFQQRHGLAVDGIVGRQTRHSLFPGVSRTTASSAEQDTRHGTLQRESPASNHGAESASVHPHAGPVSAHAATRDGPATGKSVPPELLAALAGLAALLLLVTVRRQAELGLNVGLTCAALLGVFGIGAVAGALFATRAAPRSDDGATARSGVLLADVPVADRRAPSAPHRNTTVAVPARRTPPSSSARVSAPPSPAVRGFALAARGPVIAAAPLAPAAPEAPATSQTPADQAPATHSPPRRAEAKAPSRARAPAKQKPAADSSFGGVQAGDSSFFDAAGGAGAP
jgi:peptidoglycan hydrolase-like protein with peptidoglycan-binding domain